MVLTGAATAPNYMYMRWVQVCGEQCRSVSSRCNICFECKSYGTMEFVIQMQAFIRWRHYRCHSYFHHHRRSISEQEMDLMGC
jgi:hypothetical protein